MSVKESLTYAVLTVIVSAINLWNVFVVDPINWICKLLSVTPKTTFNILEKKYRGKTCIVTGASSGIGMELAKLLSSLGANLIISSRSIDKLEEVAAQCRLLNPEVLIFPIVLDLEKYEKVDEYTGKVLETLQKYGLPPRIDVLINNAGLSSRGAAMDTSMETLERLMNVNFLGPVAVTQSIIGVMIPFGTGSIGVVSSVQGKIGIPYRTSYAASKHALQGYFDGLRAELADKNIGVTTISPGYVNTSLSLNALNADGTKYNKTDETTANGMEPSALAQQILVVMAGGVADVVVADAKTRIGILLKVLMPQLFATMMKKRVNK